MLPILYGGIMSVGVGFTLQTVGQKGADPTVAAIPSTSTAREGSGNREQGTDRIRASIAFTLLL